MKLDVDIERKLGYIKASGLDVVLMHDPYNIEYPYTISIGKETLQFNTMKSLGEHVNRRLRKIL